MKTTMSVAACLLAMAVGATRGAAAPNGALLGAAAGAGAGLVLANNVDGVHPEWAVPLLAISGGILGHELEHRWREPPYYDDAYVAPPAETAQPPEPVTDRHPGVELIKVSILNPNGVFTDVNVLRIKDRFIGPRGEAYDALPTAEMLARKYGMRAASSDSGSRRDAAQASQGKE
jgi:hypothetical protein